LWWRQGFQTLVVLLSCQGDGAMLNVPLNSKTKSEMLLAVGKASMSMG
jgi:hypothetical protein